MKFNKLWALSFLLASVPATAADPASGKITEDMPATGWSGMLLVTNATADVSLICEEGTPLCDVYRFEAELPGAGPDDSVVISLEWTPSVPEVPGQTEVDIDVYVYDDATGEEIASGVASGGGAEVVFIPAKSGKYRVDIIPYLATAQSYTGTVEYRKSGDGKSSLLGAGSPSLIVLLALLGCGLVPRRRVR